MLMQKSFLLGTTFRDNGEFLKECSFPLIDFQFLPVRSGKNAGKTKKTH